MQPPPARSRRAALHAGGAALAAALAGCLSGAPGSGDDAGTTTTDGASRTATSTRATTRRTATASADSPAHGTTIASATHPIDLSVRNDDDAAHDVTVRVRLDGEVARSGRFRLPAGMARTVTGALTYPETGERRHVVTLSLGDGTEATRAWTVHAVHVVHAVSAVVTPAGDVAWSTTVH